MITIHELRVGNRYLATPCDAFPDGGEIALDFSQIESFVHNGQDITQHLSGVGFTDEWLKQTGFVIADWPSGSMEFTTATLNHFSLIRTYSGPWGVATGNAYVRLHCGSQEIKFVHQLQDAYFSILGAPLTLRS